MGSGGYSAASAAASASAASGAAGSADVPAKHSDLEDLRRQMAELQGPDFKSSIATAVAAAVSEQMGAKFSKLTGMVMQRLLSNFKTMLSTKTTVKRALPKEYCQKACLKQALCSNGAD